MKLLMENWRKYLNESYTDWGSVDLDQMSEDDLYDLDYEELMELKEYIDEFVATGGRQSTVDPNDLYSTVVARIEAIEQEEEPLEEGWKEKLAGLAAVGAMAGAPNMAQAGPGDNIRAKAQSTLQMAKEKGQQVIDKLPAPIDRTSGAGAEAESGTSTSDGYQQNADGTHEFRVKIPLEKYATHGGKTFGEHKASNGLMQALQGEGLVTGDQISGISLSYDRDNGQVVAKWSPTSSATASAINKAMGN
jgi:hypothetical protein